MPRSPEPIAHVGPGNPIASVPAPGELRDRGKQPDPQADGGRRLAPGDGLRVRLSRIRGVTARGVLSEPLWFPAGVLEEFAIDEEASHVEYDVIGHGQFSAASPGRPGRKRRLRVLEIDTAAFYGDSPILVARGVHPLKVKRELAKLERSETAARLLVSMSRREDRRRPEVDMPVTIRSVRRSIRHGQRFTHYYAIRFVEWRDNELGRRRYGGDPPGVKSRRRGGNQRVVKHRLDANDSLHSLAKRYYGTHDVWRALASAKNVRGWGARTPLVKHQRFKVGDRITIPDKLKSGGKTYGTRRRGRAD